FERILLRLKKIIRVAVREPDAPDRELLDVALRVESGPIGFRAQYDVARLLPVLGVGVFERIAEILERRRQHLALAVEHGDMTLQFCEVAGIEEHLPRIG